jgi:dihydrofolate reductase
VAGDLPVALAAGTIASQALNAGLIDEVCIDLVPVLLGEGTSYFDALADVPLKLEDPTVIEGTGVTHLRYRVVHAA